MTKPPCLGVELGVAEAVVGLEVAVHDAEHVEVLHPLGDLGRHAVPDVPAQLKVAAGLQHGPERAPHLWQHSHSTVTA